MAGRHLGQGGHRSRRGELRLRPQWRRLILGGVVPRLGRGALAERKTGGLNDQRVGVTERRGDTSHRQGNADLACSTAYRRFRVAEGRLNVVVAEPSHPQEGTEGSRSNIARGIGQRRPGYQLVASVTGDCNSSPASDHFGPFAFHL